MAIKEKLKMRDYGQGIFGIETFYLGFEAFASCYLIIDNGQVAVIETNTNNAVPLILRALEDQGLTGDQVKYVIVTHIHLDHAGGAGKLLTYLPEAKLILHPRAARHMVDPEKLISSVRQVYGKERSYKLYGDLIPVNKELIMAVDNGFRISVGKRELVFFDSPGHARHHIIVFDQKAKAVFSGDAFGIGYPRYINDGSRMVFPSTSPTQFEPERAIDTFNKILALNPSAVYLTHFGTVKDITAVHKQLIEWINFSVDIGEKRYHQGYRNGELDSILQADIWKRFEQEISQLTGEGLSKEEREFLMLDADLNAKGIAHYINQIKT